MAAFLGQFYEDKPIPKLILVSHEPDEADLLTEAFCLKAGRRIEINKPARGEKRGLVDHALTNAREALGRRMAESSAQSKAARPGLRSLRPGGDAGADRGLRQLPHHGARTPSAA